MYVYHCATAMVPHHIANGMYGLIVVEPEGGLTLAGPLIFALTGLLILAWKVAGYYALDRFLLPLLGTPWKQATEATQPGPLTASIVSVART